MGKISILINPFQLNGKKIAAKGKIAVPSTDNNLSPMFCCLHNIPLSGPTLKADNTFDVWICINVGNSAANLTLPFLWCNKRRQLVVMPGMAQQRLLRRTIYQSDKTLGSILPFNNKKDREFDLLCCTDLWQSEVLEKWNPTEPDFERAHRSDDPLEIRRFLGEFLRKLTYNFSLLRSLPLQAVFPATGMLSQMCTTLKCPLIMCLFQFMLSSWFWNTFRVTN